MDFDRALASLTRTLKKEKREKKRKEILENLGIVAESMRIDWLWQRRIPLRKITILDGDPGLGKSLLAINIAACITTGRPMPDGTPGRQGSVILIAPEDGAEDTIKPRMEAAGGDPSRVLLLDTVDDLDLLDLKKVDIRERPFSLSHDLHELEEAIKRTKAILVVLDPLMAVLGRNIDSSRDQDVREVFTPLAQLAERTGCAILIIRHLNKGSSDNILYRGAGSIGIIAAARIGLLVVSTVARFAEQTWTAAVLAALNQSGRPGVPSAFQEVIDSGFVRESMQTGTCPLWTNDSRTPLRVLANRPGLPHRECPPQASPL